MHYKHVVQVYGLSLALFVTDFDESKFKKFFFGGTGVLTRGFSPARQVLYPLSNIFSLFGLVIFWKGTCIFLGSQPQTQSSYLCLLHS
jgi:hypothetical protein